MTTSGRPGQLGFGMAVALVMGNMIGSGVFLLPASLAAFGGLSIAGWLASAAGATCLALVFARLARLSPAAGGRGEPRESRKYERETRRTGGRGQPTRDAEATKRGQ